MADDERAPAVAAVPDGPAPVQYRFPVEVQVVDLLGEEHLQRVTRHVVEQLDTALRSRG
jgi:hypothetical protein